MTEPDEPQENPGLTWWERVFAVQQKALADIEAEQLRAARLQAAVDSPFDAGEWAGQRRELGIDQRGTDGQTHGGIRRLS